MPGLWQPGGFPPEITLAAKLTLLGAMVIRGMDYFAGDNPDTAWRLSTVESAAPLWVWGVIMLTGGIGGLVSILLRAGRGVMIAHMIGLIAYLALAAGLISDTWLRHHTTLTVLIIPSAVFGATLVFAIIAHRCSQWEHSALVVMGFGVTICLAWMSIELDGLRTATAMIASGIIHGLMAIGTASRLRQEKILDSGCDPIRGDPI
ncbi:hypothetical protein [Corynebacterium callunae]|uniref:hypothetical protein n=1 Tax=Corynebacterium callunae TaxID=1721 RepID=UPI001FFF5875|nr:hypothetical protein [Corynebacterium callunae]MCK2200468.1 hypothetical protein [Corynebacterium callunae]